MEKFEVLKYNQSVMARIGIYPYDIKKPTSKIYTSFAFYYFIISLTIPVMSGTVLILQKMSDFKSIIRDILMIIGSIQSFAVYYFIGLKINKIKTLHLNLQKTIDEGMLNLFFERKHHFFHWGSPQLLLL